MDAAERPLPPSVVAGEVPLTPIQQWFFEQKLAEPHHYNQAFVLDVARSLSQKILEKAAATVARHHDGLRLRYIARERRLASVLCAGGRRRARSSGWI